MSGLRRFAEAFVALAASNHPGTSAAALRKALDTLSQKYQTQVAKFWEDANTESLRLLVLVLQNNPKKTKVEILKRPDIQAILRDPYLEAAKKSEDLLRKAWDDAEEAAVAHTQSDLKMLGEAWKGYGTDTGLRDALISDLYKNAKAMRGRYSDALGDAEKSRMRLHGIGEDGKRRAQYSVQVSVWGVASQVKDSAAQAAGVNKMWVAVMDDRTCSHCKALNGTVIGPGAQFAHDAGDNPLGVYLGSLIGPPRHPNCRCVLVLTIIKKTKTKN